MSKGGERRACRRELGTASRPGWLLHEAGSGHKAGSRVPGQGVQTRLHGWWGATDGFLAKTGSPHRLVSKDKAVSSFNVSGTSSLSHLAF